MRLFYANDIQGKEYLFKKEESGHIIRVLRLKNGDKILITDGQGCFYTCEITNANQKQCVVKILEQTPIRKHPYHLHIAMAPTKQIDRFEWFLEKATEIGIDEITPIITQNSERKIIKHERLQKVIESAMKQSHKAYHPKLNEAINLDEFWLKPHSETHQLMAHCYQSNKSTIQDIVKPHDNTLIMIGPEGDFSIEEVQTSEKYGFSPISLGNYRLRTETAGMVACNYLSFIN